ncbi:hypothetical protein IJV79_00075 [bacterium]|nr:hypothetical protein [bacterium]
MDCYVYKTCKGDRWDKIAHTFYGNCYEIAELIETNTHLSIKDVFEGEEIVYVPVKEQVNENLPPWKGKV